MQVSSGDLAVRGDSLILNYPSNSVQLKNNSGALEILTDGVERLSIDSSGLVLPSGSDIAATGDLSVTGNISILGITNGLVLPSVTDAELVSLVGTTGQVAFNVDTAKLQVYTGATFAVV